MTYLLYFFAGLLFWVCGAATGAVWQRERKVKQQTVKDVTPTLVLVWSRGRRVN